MNRRVACLFCADHEAKLSSEHVLSESIRKHIHVSPSYLAQIEYQPANSTRRTIRAQFRTALPTFQRRIYCETCNSGWMQEMDVQIEPIVAPLIKNSPPTYQIGHRDQVAAWATKLALVCESLNGSEKVPPDSEYHRFYAERMPLSTQPIDLARYFGERRFGYMHRVLHEGDGYPLTESHPTVGVLVTVIVGHLVIRTILPGTRPLTVPVALQGAAEHVSPVWPPIIKGPIPWPPQYALNDSQIEEFGLGPNAV